MGVVARLASVSLVLHPDGANCWGDLRLTEFHQVLVRGARVEAPDVKVGLAQLLAATAAAAVAEGGSGGVAAAAVVVVGAWWSHLVVGGRHIRLLRNRMKT